MRLPTTALVIIATTSPALAQHLVVTDRLNQRVMLLDADSGRIVNTDYIAPPPGTLFATAEAIQVNDEIWVSEPGLDDIHRFSVQTGQLVATVDGPFAVPLDRPAGLAFDGSTVLVTCTFLAKHLSGSWITRVSPSGASLGAFDAFNDNQLGDVQPYEGAFLVVNRTTRRLERVTSSGVHQGVFASLEQDKVFTVANQISPRAAGGVLVASNAGILVLDTNGAQLDRLLPDEPFNGVAELAGGRLLLSSAFGIFRLEPGGQLVTLFEGAAAGIGVSANAGSISPLAGSPACHADFALPIGQIDFSDVTAFLSAFAAQSPGADLAAPFALYDFSDVIAFLSDFARGCP